MGTLGASISKNYPDALGFRKDKTNLRHTRYEISSLFTFGKKKNYSVCSVVECPPKSPKKADKEHSEGQGTLGIQGYRRLFGESHTAVSRTSAGLRYFVNRFLLIGMLAYFRSQLLRPCFWRLWVVCLGNTCAWRRYSHLYIYGNPIHRPTFLRQQHKGMSPYHTRLRSCASACLYAISPPIKPPPPS